MSNSDWCILFLEAKEKFLTSTTSYHYQFCYVAQCDQSSIGLEMASNSRMLGYLNQGLVILLLEKYGENMLKWSKNNSHTIRKEIESLHSKIERVRYHVGYININYFTTLKRRMNSLLVKDDMFRKKRAKTHWYKDEDLNTQFFHITTTTRKKI